MPSHFLSRVCLLFGLLSQPLAAYAGEPPRLRQYGVPDNQILAPPGEFLIGTPDRTRCPRWTLECLTAESLRGNAARELEHWHTDLRVCKELRVTAKDYAGGLYDRGHLACAANHVSTNETMAATFTFANTMPQTPALNRGPWAQLEAKIRALAAQPDTTVWVLTMPVWQRDGKGHIGVVTIGDGTWVPTHCGKAVLCEKAEELTLECWLLPNDMPVRGPGSRDVSETRNYRVSGDALEAVSGLDLFSGLPDEIEDKLEAAVPPQ